MEALEARRGESLVAEMDLVDNNLEPFFGKRMLADPKAAAGRRRNPE